VTRLIKVCDFQKATSLFRAHAANDYHTESMTAAKDFTNAGQTIVQQLNDIGEEKRAENRRM
jgi:hypothetical protein